MPIKCLICSNKIVNEITMAFTAGVVIILSGLDDPRL